MTPQSYEYPNNSVNTLKITPAESLLLKQICKTSKLKERDLLLLRQIEFFSRKKAICYASNTALLEYLSQFTPKTLRCSLLNLEQAKLIARTVITKRSGGSLRLIIPKTYYPLFCAKQRSFGNINIAESTEHYFESPDSPKKIDLNHRFRFSLLDKKHEITPEEHVSAARQMSLHPQVSVSHDSKESPAKNSDLGAPSSIFLGTKNKRKTYSKKVPEAKDVEPQKAPVQSPVVLSSLEKELRRSLPKEKIPEAMAIASTFSPSKLKSIRNLAAYLSFLIKKGVTISSFCSGEFSVEAMSNTEKPLFDGMSTRKIATKFVECAQTIKLDFVTVDMGPEVLMVYTNGADTSTAYQEISLHHSPVIFIEKLSPLCIKYHLTEALEELKSCHLTL